MSKHTPGPWVVREDPRTFRPSVENEAGTYFIAHVDECMAKEANARLIAAAPDLLEALERILDLYEHDEGCTELPQYVAAVKAISRAKVEDKPIELPPKLIEDARDFVTIQQNASLAAIQNQFRVGYQKAEAILKALESEGVVKFVGTDQAGQYELVRSAPVVTTEQGEKVEIDPETAKVFYATAVKAVMKAGSADDSVMRAIYGDDDNSIEVALMAMEEDGIVSAPSPEGLRDVLVLPGEAAE